VESSDTRQQLLAAGVEPTPLPADAFAGLIASEVSRFAKIAEKAGIVAEQ
jgi:tripartite-type tricarboxylate transporter receptor subunit TctC